MIVGLVMLLVFLLFALWLMLPAKAEDDDPDRPGSRER